MSNNTLNTHGNIQIFPSKINIFKEEMLTKTHTQSSTSGIPVSSNSHLSQNEFHAINYYTILKWHKNEFT